MGEQADKKIVGHGFSARTLLCDGSAPLRFLPLWLLMPFSLLQSLFCLQPVHASANRCNNDEVAIELQGDQKVIRSARRPRQGWEEAFRWMAKNGDDRLIDGDLANQNSWDDEEWDWQQ
jgi:antitoxin MazE